MIVLDANALLALLLGEPAESEVAELLRRSVCATPAPCLSEVVDRLVRRHGVEPGRVVDRLGLLIDASLGVLAIENRIGWLAGELRATHCDRKTATLSLSDCILLASTGTEDKLATADRAVALTARALNLEVIPLLDSKGNRPAV